MQQEQQKQAAGVIYEMLLTKIRIIRVHLSFQSSLHPLRAWRETPLF
jgi:hypothetical protein